MNIEAQQHTEAGYPLGLIDRLRELKEACQTSNQNHVVIVLAIACIEEGVDTKPHIIGALRRLGFGPPHVGALLDREAGANPKLYRWHKSREGRYTVHPD